MPTLCSFKPKLLKPCKKLLRALMIPCKRPTLRPISIKPLRFPNLCGECKLKPSISVRAPRFPNLCRSQSPISIRGFRLRNLCRPRRRTIRLRKPISLRCFRFRNPCRVGVISCCQPSCRRPSCEPNCQPSCEPNCCEPNCSSCQPSCEPNCQPSCELPNCHPSCELPNCRPRCLRAPDCLPACRPPKCGLPISSCHPRPPKFRPIKLVLWPSKKRSTNKKADRVRELKNTMTERVRAPFPSPITPAYIKMARHRRDESDGGPDEVEEACRSFENYLVEMIVEEGKVKDLTDVEELLYCWNSLKSPVFIELVCRFYGELCKDLFTGSEYEGLDESDCLDA